MSVKLHLYLLTQTVLDSYDTYNSAVVAANDEQEAVYIHPDGKGKIKARYPYNDTDEWFDDDRRADQWPDNVELITVKLIGDAAQGIELGVICASFRAG